MNRRDGGKPSFTQKEFDVKFLLHFANEKETPMNKGEFIAAVSEASGSTSAETKRVLDAAFDIIEDNLCNGEDVTIAGFGTFSTTERAARTGRNPHTGEQLKIAASTAPKFKPAKALKEAVNS